MTGKIFLKLIAGIFCLLVVALVTVDYFATEVATNAYVENLTQQLADKGRMIALTFPEPERLSPAEIRDMAHAAGGRLTIVRSDGGVVVDSEANAASMENHRTRPELIQAFRGGVGSSVRHSATLGVSFLYVAIPIPRGAVRIAVPLSRVNDQVSGIRWKILFSAAVGFLPAILLAALVSRALSRRFARIISHAGELARGNFRARLPDTDGSELGQLAAALNETSEKLQHTVEQLQREHTELEKLERVRKDFVINVSHELRTPLASIQGYTETLMDGALDDPEHNMRFLGIIRHNAERLARLTADLLSLSRIELKRQNFEFDEHPINRLLDDAVELIQPIAARGDIGLAEERAPDEATVWCDSEAVSQILSNLLDNAVKYTPAGGQITLGARTGEGFSELFVRDTGTGIPAEELPRLFERFYRVDKARSRELGGTGLGLAIVKHLVAAHNGVIRVESEPDRGTTFYFTLPAEQAMLRPDTQLNPEFTAP